MAVTFKRKVYALKSMERLKFLPLVLHLKSTRHPDLYNKTGSIHIRLKEFFSLPFGKQGTPKSNDDLQTDAERKD